MNLLFYVIDFVFNIKVLNKILLKPTSFGVITINNT